MLWQAQLAAEPDGVESALSTPFSFLNAQSDIKRISLILGFPHLLSPPLYVGVCCGLLKMLKLR
jgi:hypothetical protein